MASTTGLQRLPAMRARARMRVFWWMAMGAENWMASGAGVLFVSRGSGPFRV